MPGTGDQGSPDSAAAHISSVTTDPDYRRSGYAAALTAWVTAEFLRGGAEMVTLGMYANNVGARKLYRHLGLVDRQATRAAD